MGKLEPPAQQPLISWTALPPAASTEVIVIVTLMENQLLLSSGEGGGPLSSHKPSTAGSFP